MATVPPATQVAMKSPTEGSNVGGEATKTTDDLDLTPHKNRENQAIQEMV